MQQKGNAPEVFMKRYKDANRSLNPYASVDLDVQ